MIARLAQGLGATALAIGLGLLVAVKPELGLAVALAALGAAVLAARPELLTLAVAFAIYANVPAVAVKFWSVPWALAAVVPALLALPALHAVLWRREGVIVPPESPWIALYALAAGLGAVFARDPASSAAALQELLLEGLVLYVLVVNAVRGATALRAVTWALLAAGFLMGIVPLLQQATGAFEQRFAGFGQLHELPFYAERPTGDDPGVRQHRLAGSIGEINRYAQVMLMLVPLGLVLALRERAARHRWLALGITAVVLGGFALAFSRGGAVAAVVLLLAMLCLREVRARQALAVVLGGCLLLAVFPQYLARLGTLPGVATLTGQAERAPDGAVKGRITEMIAAAQVFADHPLVGVGPGMFRHYAQEYGNKLNLRRLDEARQAHNLYLDIAAEGGALGLAGFCGLVGTTLLRLLRARRRLEGVAPREAMLASAFLLMILTYLATGLFLHLSYQRYFWLTMALGAAASRLQPPTAR